MEAPPAGAAAVLRNIFARQEKMPNHMAEEAVPSKVHPMEEAQALGVELAAMAN